MERIFREVGVENEVNADAPGQLYYKAELIKSYEADEQEISWLAGGVPSEIEKVKGLSIRDYYNLMLYVFKQKKQEPVENGDHD